MKMKYVFYVLGLFLSYYLGYFSRSICNNWRGGMPDIEDVEQATYFPSMCRYCGVVYLDDGICMTCKEKAKNDTPLIKASI